jgi:hypothetical protein
MLTYPDISTNPGWEKWKRGDPQDKRERALKKAEAKKAQRQAQHNEQPVPAQRRKAPSKSGRVRRRFNNVRLPEDEPEAQPKPEAANATEDGEPKVNDGWNRSKVQRDVMAVAQLKEFTTEQKAEWEALFQRHEMYQTPESLPSSPDTISCGTPPRSYTFNGVPDWGDLWRVLRRYPRPHHSQPPGQPPGQPPPPMPPPPPPPHANGSLALTDGAAAGANAVIPFGQLDTLTDEDRAALLNRVSAPHHPKRIKEHAVNGH